MSKNIIDAVLHILNKERDDILELKIEAFKNEILSYLNRDEITEEMFPSVALAISECIKNDEMGGNIQSLSEGDMSVTYAVNSPFFGKLEPFKVIRGIKNV